MEKTQKKHICRKKPRIELSALQQYDELRLHFAMFFFNICVIHLPTIFFASLAQKSIWSVEK